MRLVGTLGPGAGVSLSRDECLRRAAEWRQSLERAVLSDPDRRWHQAWLRYWLARAATAS